MNKIVRQLVWLILLTIILILPYLVFAQNPSLDLLKKVGSDGGPYTHPADSSGIVISKFLGTIVSVFLSLLGVIFIGLMIYAGYNWMTAQGEEEKVTKAKDTIRQSIIGLVLVIAAYAIWLFVYFKIIV